MKSLKSQNTFFEEYLGNTASARNFLIFNNYKKKFRLANYNSFGQPWGFFNSLKASA